MASDLLRRFGVMRGQPSDAKVAQLEAELATYRHAFETTAADRDRLASVLSSLVSSTRVADSRTEVDDPAAVLRRIVLGVLGHSLMSELHMPPDAIPARLSSKFVQHANWVDYLDGSREDLRRAASDGLLDLADFLMREAATSELASRFVESALQLDDRFRGARHSLWLYFARKEVGGLESYFARGVKEGVWPDEATRVAQRSALNKGVPSILFVTLPKSGSIFLWSTVLNSLQVPNFSIAVPGGTSGGISVGATIVPELISIFAEGGFLAAHHFAPTDRNLALLKKSGLKKFIFHIRDPRQAAVSWWHYNKKIGNLPHRDWTQDEIEEEIWREYFVPRTKWLHDWLHVIESDPDFDIMISTQEAMAGNEHDHITGLLDFLQIPRAAYSLVASPKTDAAHFRRGAKDEWLEFFSDGFKQRSLEHVPNKMARRFGWQEVD